MPFIPIIQIGTQVGHIKVGNFDLFLRVLCTKEFSITSFFESPDFISVHWVRFCTSEVKKYSAGRYCRAETRGTRAVLG